MVTWQRLAYADEVTLDGDTDVSGVSWVLDEDDLASDDDTKVPTQQSVKAYVDAQIAKAMAMGTL